VQRPESGWKDSRDTAGKSAFLHAAAPRL